MTVFYLLAALMLLAALWIVFRALAGQARIRHIEQDAVNIQLYKQQLAELQADLDSEEIDPAQFALAHEELKQKLLADVPGQARPEAHATHMGKATAVSLLAAVAALAIGLYAFLGTPEAVRVSPGTSVPAQGHPATAKPGGDSNVPSVDEMVAVLEERMQQHQDDAEGWMLLARSYVHLRQFDKAEQAYTRLIQLVEPNEDMLADYADIIAVNQKGDLTGRPQEILARALKLNPDHPKALWLEGTAYYQQKDYARAARTWRHLRTLLPAESEERRMLDASIADAHRMMGVDPDQATADTRAQRPVTPEPAAPAVAAMIRGTVDLDAALKEKVRPEDTVFVYARAVSGPRMPLAIVRKQVRDLPLQFTLDDSMAMMPQMKLSNFKEVIVSARVSPSGNAMPQSGDLVSENFTSQTHDAPALRITIQKQIP